MSDEHLLIDISLGDLLGGVDDMSTTPTGDLSTVAGVSNVEAAIIRRILCVPGSLAHRPDYGAGLLSYKNAPLTLPMQQRLARDIRAQLKLETRVQEVKSIAFNYNDNAPDRCVLTLVCVIVGYGEKTVSFTPFSLVG